MTARWRWMLALAVAFAAAVALDLALDASYPAVMPVLGFVGCAVLIGTANALSAVLSRPEGTRAGEPGGPFDESGGGDA